MIVRKQSDSYESYFSSSEYADVSSFGGTWALVKTIGTAPVLTGSVIADVPKKRLVCHISPGIFINTQPGDYVLVTKIISETEEFSQEIHQAFRLERSSL